MKRIQIASCASIAASLSLVSAVAAADPGPPLYSGDAVSCAFSHSFDTIGAHALEVRVADVVPDDWDTSNNSAALSVLSRSSSRELRTSRGIPEEHPSANVLHRVVLLVEPCRGCLCRIGQFRQERLSEARRCAAAAGGWGPASREEVCGRLRPEQRAVEPPIEGRRVRA